jgi:membrane fusion protein, adhesin transport system
MSAIAVDPEALFGENDQSLRASKRVVWVFAALLLAGVVWAWLATLDEVATGTGRIVPTTNEQVIESLEGGILKKLYVKQDDIVEAGQVLAQLDPTQAGSTAEESAAKYRAALAAASRLRAEVNGTPLSFPTELDGFPELKEAEQRLYDTRRRSLASSFDLVEQSLGLIRREVAIAQSLIDVGAASTVEVIRLQRQQSELELKKADLRSQYMVTRAERSSWAAMQWPSLPLRSMRL